MPKAAIQVTYNRKNIVQQPYNDNGANQDNWIVHVPVSFRYASMDPPLSAFSLRRLRLQPGRRVIKAEDLLWPQLVNKSKISFTVLSLMTMIALRKSDANVPFTLR